MEREDFITPAGREPALPPEGFQIYQIWQELDAMRQAGMNGPPPLTFSDIHAYCQLQQMILTRWAIRMLIVIDVMYRHAYYVATTDPKKKGSNG